MEAGQQLRAARESLRISLEELEAHTKIQKQYLSAIENGQLHLLPGAIYVRSYVRTYALAVGLDPHKILHQLQNARPASVRSRQNAPASQQNRNRRLSRTVQQEEMMSNDNRWQPDQELATTRSFGNTVRWDPKRVEDRLKEVEQATIPPSRPKRRSGQGRPQQLQRSIPVPNDLPTAEELGLSPEPELTSRLSKQNSRDSYPSESNKDRRLSRHEGRRKRYEEDEAEYESTTTSLGRSGSRAEGRRGKTKKKTSLYTKFLIFLALILAITAGYVFYLRAASSETAIMLNPTNFKTSAYNIDIFFENEKFLLDYQS